MSLCPETAPVHMCIGFFSNDVRKQKHWYTSSSFIVHKVYMEICSDLQNSNMHMLVYWNLLRHLLFSIYVQ